MLKFSKRFAVFLFSIFVLILGLYFFWTNNHYDRKIFLSGEEATKNWGVNANIVFFEYSDENFYIKFDSNHNIKSAKKEGLFWIRNNFDGFTSDKKVNHIRSATVNDTMYIFGVTKYKNVKEIKLVDYSSNEKTLEFTGKNISDIDGLCFCAKIPFESLILSYKIVFIDQNGNAISDSLQNVSENLQTYITPIINNISSNKYEQVTNENLTLNKVEFSRNEVEKKFYLVRDEKEFLLQEVSRNIDIYFLNEYALVVDKTKVLQITLNKTENTFYSTTYRASYDENLSNLRKAS